MAREDIEHHPDFEKFRTYRNIREGGGGTAAYRRPSRASLGGELEGPQFSHGRQSRLRRAGPSRTVRERLRDFLASRAAHSLYIWSPQDKFRVWCQEMSEEGGLDFIILIFIAANCITLAMERPTIPPWSTERKILNVCNNLFTLVFTLEMAMKVERSMIEADFLPDC